ncbi:hypothetical protein EJ08DRAFT_694643 [Tothia fuscella]|uniref:Uncharacterized protein n=1 Tax=Tothia fuscella TaxID=1048955 RepID=A0A9P4NXW1_9PEZI|nr:hypothetical protein EJ08DRAFT_694643 [Tothia fuscella]
MSSQLEASIEIDANRRGLLFGGQGRKRTSIMCQSSTTITPSSKIIGNWLQVQIIGSSEGIEIAKREIMRLLGSQNCRIDVASREPIVSPAAKDPPGLPEQSAQSDGESLTTSDLPTEVPRTETEPPRHRKETLKYRNIRYPKESRAKISVLFDLWLSTRPIKRRRQKAKYAFNRAGQPFKDYEKRFLRYAKKKFPDVDQNGRPREVEGRLVAALNEEKSRKQLASRRCDPRETRPTQGTSKDFATVERDPQYLPQNKSSLNADCLPAARSSEPKQDLTMPESSDHADNSIEVPSAEDNHNIGLVPRRKDTVEKITSLGKEIQDEPLGLARLEMMSERLSEFDRKQQELAEEVHREISKIRGEIEEKRTQIKHQDDAKGDLPPTRAASTHPDAHQKSNDETDEGHTCLSSSTITQPKPRQQRAQTEPSQSKRHKRAKSYAPSSTDVALLLPTPPPSSPDARVEIETRPKSSCQSISPSGEPKTESAKRIRESDDFRSDPVCASSDVKRRRLERAKTVDPPIKQEPNGTQISIPVEGRRAGTPVHSSQLTDNNIKEDISRNQSTKDHATSVNTTPISPNRGYYAGGRYRHESSVFNARPTDNHSHESGFPPIRHFPTDHSYHNPPKKSFNKPTYRTDEHNVSRIPMSKRPSSNVAPASETVHPPFKQLRTILSHVAILQNSKEPTASNRTRIPASLEASKLEKSKLPIKATQHQPTILSEVLAGTASVDVSTGPKYKSKVKPHPLLASASASHTSNIRASNLPPAPAVRPRKAFEDLRKNRVVYRSHGNKVLPKPKNEHRQKEPEMAKSSCQFPKCPGMLPKVFVDAIKNKTGIPSAKKFPGGAEKFWEWMLILSVCKDKWHANLTSRILKDDRLKNPERVRAASEAIAKEGTLQWIWRNHERGVQVSAGLYST